MTQPLDLSHTEKPQQIQANLIAYMRLFAGLPDVTVHDGNSFWIASRDPIPGRVILRARWQPDDAEQQIDALFEQVGAVVDQIDWMIFPGDAPDDLGKRLEARGMPGGLAGNWLWTNLNALGDPPIVPDTFHVQPVRDDESLATWVHISEQGFGESLTGYHESYARLGYGTEDFWLHYIGFLGDTAVTSGTLLDAGGCATIYDISTPQNFRRQGFGSAITHALMREIHQRGYADTWIWSSNMAKNVYQSLGYVDAEFGVREHKWRKHT